MIQKVISRAVPEKKNDVQIRNHFLLNID